MSGGDLTPRPGQRGSVLMLMPAAVLVLLVLGAAAVDGALVLMAQRELLSATAAAANDAAGAALAEERFYDCGVLVLSQQQAAEVAAASFAARTSDAVEVVEGPRVTLTPRSGDERVEVTVRARGAIMPIFAPALSEAGRWEVTARSVATTEEDAAIALPAGGC